MSDCAWTSLPAVDNYSSVAMRVAGDVVFRRQGRYTLGPASGEFARRLLLLRLAHRRTDADDVALAAARATLCASAVMFQRRMLSAVKSACLANG